MTNPLTARRAAARDYEPAGPRYGTQEWCDWRNSVMPRTDIEWALGEGGCYLRHRQAWSLNHTRDLERKSEQDRRDWQHRQTYPVGGNNG